MLGSTPPERNTLYDLWERLRLSENKAGADFGSSDSTHLCDDLPDLTRQFHTVSSVVRNRAMANDRRLIRSGAAIRGLLRPVAVAVVLIGIPNFILAS